MIIQLTKNYELRKVTAEEFDPFFKKYGSHYFDESRESYWPLLLLNPAEKQKADVLRDNFRKDLFELYYLLYKVENDTAEVAGWTTGAQCDTQSFYMRNSLVFTEHRRQGLYSKMAQQVLEDLTELGFLKIKSNHVATNNPILIAKLRLGFKIHGFELDEKNGVIVNMCYLTTDHGSKVLEYRAGALKRSQVPEGILS